MSGERREQFGRPLRERTDEGTDEIGQDRAGLHESRYVEDAEQLVRLDHSQPVDDPPLEEASEASDAGAGRSLPTRPDPLTATPPGPSVWEAREPSGED